MGSPPSCSCCPDPRSLTQVKTFCASVATSDVAQWPLGSGGDITPTKAHLPWVARNKYQSDLWARSNSVSSKCWWDIRRGPRAHSTPARPQHRRPPAQPAAGTQYSVIQNIPECAPKVTSHARGSQGWVHLGYPQTVPISLFNEETCVALFGLMFQTTANSVLNLLYPTGHEKHTHSTDGYTAGNSPVPAPALSTSHPFPTFPREIQLSLLKPQTTDVPPQNACLETTKGPLHLLSSLVVLVVLAMVGFNWSY